MERDPCLSPVPGRYRPAPEFDDKVFIGVYVPLEDRHVTSDTVMGVGIATRSARLAQHLSDTVSGLVLSLVVTAIERLNCVYILEDAVAALPFQRLGLGFVGPKQAASVVVEAAERVHRYHVPADLVDHLPQLGDFVHPADVVVQTEGADVPHFGLYFQGVKNHDLLRGCEFTELRPFPVRTMLREADPVQPLLFRLKDQVLR